MSCQYGASEGKFLRLERLILDRGKLGRWLNVAIVFDKI
jgi:hypothetical protein